jgi:hypothetical protein
LWQRWNAGAFVEFETNRGRIFSYETTMTTKAAGDMVTFRNRFS